MMLHDTKHDLSQDSQDLLNAADYIDQHGWCQHIKRQASGEVCLFGSLLSVTEGLDKTYSHKLAPRASKLYDTLCLILGMPATTWNDRVARTKDEVTTFLRNTAMKSKE